MKSINLKKLILPNLPYLLFVFLFDKVGQAARLAPGADFSGKLLSIGDGFAAAFSSLVPSLHPADLLVGVLGAALIRLIVYVKGKNAKKYRRGAEWACAGVMWIWKTTPLTFPSSYPLRCRRKQKSLRKWHRRNPTGESCLSQSLPARSSSNSLLCRKRSANRQKKTESHTMTMTLL